jgi:hypothetical protein
MPCMYWAPRAMLIQAALAAQLVQSLADPRKGEAFVFLGDFNFTPGSAPYQVRAVRHEGDRKKTGKEAGGQEPFLSRQARAGVTHKKTRAHTAALVLDQESNCSSIPSARRNQVSLNDDTHMRALLLCSCLPQRPCRIGIRTTLDLQVRGSIRAYSSPASERADVGGRQSQRMLLHPRG